MKPKLLLLVTSDPRSSGRPAEAIRIAAGVGAWKKADVTIYLHGPAVLSASEWVDELREGDNFTRYLPIVADFGRPVYVQAGAPELAKAGELSVKTEAIDDTRLAELTAAATYVMRF
jgi:hypothetical protein